MATPHDREDQGIGDARAEEMVAQQGEVVIERDEPPECRAAAPTDLVQAHDEQAARWG